MSEVMISLNSRVFSHMFYEVVYLPEKARVFMKHEDGIERLQQLQATFDVIEACGHYKLESIQVPLKTIRIVNEINKADCR